MLAASLDADVPLFMARPTSAWASAGASLVPSPVIATRWPSACSRRMIAILSSGLASATKSSTPASRAMVAAVSGLSPVIMIVRTPIAPELVEALAQAGLDGVLELDEAHRPPVRADRQWRRAGSGDHLGLGHDLGRHRAVELCADGIDRALEDESAIGQHDAAGAGLGAERLGLGDRGVETCESSVVGEARRCSELPESTACEVDDGATLGRLVAERRDERGAQRVLLRDAGSRDDPGRQPIAEGDGAGLVEQDHVDVAGGLDGAAAHGQHVEAGHAVHAGDADRRQQAADRGRDEAHQERDQLDDADGLTGEHPERPERDHGQQEHERQAGEQDRERDLVRRPLPLGALDERDHPVQERLARVGRDADDELVADDLRAAGHADRMSVPGSLSTGADSPVMAASLT